MSREKLLAYYQWAVFLSTVGSSTQAFSTSMGIASQGSLSVPVALAIAALLAYWPGAIFPLFGGILSDRFERWTIVLGAQAFLMCQSLLLTRFHTETIALYIIGTTGGIVAALSGPARTGLLKDIAGEKYAQVNAKNSVYSQAGEIIGGTAGSLLFFQAHLAGITYLADAASYLPMIVVLVFLLPKTTISNAPTKAKRKDARATLREAYTFLSQDAILKRVLILRLILALGANGGYVAQPVLASEVFGGLQAYTWFMVANALGSLIGSSLAARLLGTKEPSIRGVLTGAVASLLLIAATGLSHSLPLTLAIMLGECIAYPYSGKHSTPLLVVQENRLRERITGLMQTTTMVCTIMCNVLNGLLMTLIGVRSTWMVLGAAGILAMGFYEIQGRMKRSD
ncbi:MFS transporter [Ktedonospora formicarum]|uniref:MFS transporter n=1 Tax=Ktedonospora formicarum TaxID=2778364 RepID=A0A8J3I8I1_9CHLR|nr:MFS transporter [Ktedonospora formicarum]GHO47359.1 hypothetical protein KSX_55220 [Ktedonospora formicarum]